MDTERAGRRSGGGDLDTPGQRCAKLRRNQIRPAICPSEQIETSAATNRHRAPDVRAPTGHNWLDFERDDLRLDAGFENPIGLKMLCIPVLNLLPTTGRNEVAWSMQREIGARLDGHNERASFYC